MRSLFTLAFTEQAEDRMAACLVAARCVRNGHFISIEDPPPAAPRMFRAATRSEYVGFVLNGLGRAESNSGVWRHPRDLGEFQPPQALNRYMSHRELSLSAALTDRLLK